MSQASPSRVLVWIFPFTNFSARFGNIFHIAGDAADVTKVADEVADGVTDRVTDEGKTNASSESNP